jgi:hypothetical protein
MLSIPEILIRLVGEALRWCCLAFRSTRSISAENLFLRRQLALYIERGINPRRIDYVTRISLAIFLKILQLAGSLSYRSTRDDHPLASSGMEVILAMEVPVRPATDS